ncbi:ferritin family protein [Alkalibaculum sporogenes]|uniref:ferritin family protein n=1 Tax=Alkalibaculum sporogenes TaxID=2655001 RepID=UPI00187B449B|nr:ferritin-like domain-containing protein [Alkalibaculum sporogenes]
MNFNESTTCNNNYLPKLILDLEEYIQSELQDSAFYEELSAIAPTGISSELLLEFSDDEKIHAESLQTIYSKLKGRSYTPKPLLPVQINDFTQALIQRIEVETRDYKKYGKHYLDAPTNDLQDLFFSIRDIEAQHAMRIPILLEDLRDRVK